MDRRQQREWAQALAFLSGDRRDWPLRCGWCGSSDLIDSQVRQALVCQDCHHETSMRVAHELREERARAEVMSGVGGPLVGAMEKKHDQT